MKNKSRLTLILLIVMSLFNHGVLTEHTVIEKQKGMTFASWSASELLSADSDLALEQVRDTGANWISLIVTQYQDSIHSTKIAPSEKTPTDEALAHAVESAHALGLKVMLKPHVDLSNDPTHWRADIGTHFTSADWNEWFESYREMILHYASFAEEHGVDQFSVGTELIHSTRYANKWRAIVAAVRERFSGMLTYSANHSGEELRINWWDALDYIGIDAYYPLSLRNNPTLTEMEVAWQQVLIALRGLYRAWGKPILFTELGYLSQDGTTTRPYAYGYKAPLDLQEQADAYQAFFNQVFWQPWFAGVYWWAWEPKPYTSGKCDAGFTPYEKPAENVIRKGYDGLPRVSDLTVFQLGVNNTFVLEEGKFVNDWRPEAWVKGEENVSLLYSPDKYVQVETGQRSGLVIRFDAFNTSPYQVLEVIVKAEDTNKNWWIQLVDSEGNPLRRLPLENCRYQFDDASAGDWQVANFPLAALFAADKEVAEIHFINTGKDVSSLTLYEIEFLSAAEPVD